MRVLPTLLKINLYYDTTWWGTGLSGQPSVEFGPNFSDLPVGSIYPFYTMSEEVAAGLEYSERVTDPEPGIKEKLDKISKSKFQKKAALTIYCDYLNINFWSGLQNNGSLFSSPLQDEYSADPPTLFAASNAVVREATKFFKLIFNTHYVPEPILTSARIWEGSVEFDIKPSQQFGYGVHQWAIGTDDRQVIEDLIEPLDNLYTCGEAFSDYQGWVEGALRSTDLVLKKAFSLEPLSDIYEMNSKQKPSAAIRAAYDKNATARIQTYIDGNYTPTQDDSGEMRLNHGHRMGVHLSYLDTK